MIDADGLKERFAIRGIAGILGERVGTESVFRIGSVIDQSLPAFIGPRAGPEASVEGRCHSGIYKFYLQEQ